MFNVDDVFASLTKYEESWRRDGDPQPLGEKTKASVKVAKVVDGDYGLSCEFTTHSGQKMYMPLERDCARSVGDILDIENIRIIKLIKDGRKPIYKLIG